MGHSEQREGRSSPLDFDRLIGTKAEVRQAVEDAEIAAYVGELVRQLRTRKGMTQSDLANKSGITQAHISELERGLGAKGPTVVTLARILSALEDKLQISTVNELETHEANQINEAKSFATNITRRFMSGAPAKMATAAMSSVPEPKEDKRNPFMRTFLQGIALGIVAGKYNALHGTDLYTRTAEITRPERDIFRKALLDIQRKREDAVY